MSALWRYLTSRRWVQRHPEHGPDLWHHTDELERQWWQAIR
jgi:hypothetical protein